MIRKALVNDLACIMKVIEDGRLQLKNQNSNQWNTSSYPDETDLLNDLICNNVFIYEINKEIIGVIVAVKNDNEYKKLDYINVEEYYALHRIAVKSNHLNLGIATKLILHCYNELKRPVIIDTHENNNKMRSLITKCGFTLEGKMILSYVKIDAERLVYIKG